MQSTIWKIPLSVGNEQQLRTLLKTSSSGVSTILQDGALSLLSRILERYNSMRGSSPAYCVLGVYVITSHNEEVAIANFIFLWNWISLYTFLGQTRFFVI